MAHGHCGILALKQQGYRLADNVAATDYNRVLAGHSGAGAFDQLDHTCWRAGQEAVIPDNQVPHIDRMEAVHIFFYSDGINYSLLVNVLRKRKLNQNPVNFIPAVQFGHERQQFLLACRSIQSVDFRMETELGTGLLFIAHIDLGSRIFTDQHNSKTRLYAPFGQLGNFPGNVNTNFV
ncbi:hypothetical protein D3C81_1588740 [compost metagenome]